MADKKFQLTEDLEGIIRFAEKAHTLHERARENPKLENVDLRKQISQFYGKPLSDGKGGYNIDPDDRFLETNPASFLDLVDAKTGNAYSRLEKSFDGYKYKQAIAYFTSGLDKEVKTNFYATLIINGILPEEPSKELKNVAEKLAVAKEIKKAVQENRYADAENLVDAIISGDQRKELRVNARYAAPLFREYDKEVYTDIATAQEGIAMRIIDEKKLYNEIDKAAASTAYGKAISLVYGYKSQKLQERINEEKAQETNKRRE